MTRMFVKVLLAMFISTMLLSAAGSQEDAEKTVITIVVRGGETRDFPRWVEGAAKKYKEIKPDIRIELNEVNASWGEYYTKVSLMLQSDSSIDITFEDSFILKADVAAGLLSPLTPEDWPDWNTQYSDAIKKGITVDGKVYSIPFATDVRGLFYNVPLFKEAGLPEDWHPKSWNEVLTAARAIKNLGKTDVIPFYLNSSKANGEATTMQSAQMLWYGTNDTMYENDKWVVSSPGLLDTLSFFETIYTEGLGPPLSLALSGQGTNSIYQEYAKQDRVGITLDGMWVPQNWIDNWDEWQEHYKFTAMPTQNGQGAGFNSMSGVWGLAINAKSKHRNEAWEFIKFLNNKENIFDLVEIATVMIARSDVTKMPEYSQIGVLETANKFLEFTKFRPINEEYPGVSAELQVAVEAVVAGDKSPQEAMDEYAQAVGRVLGEDRITTIDG